VASLFLVRYGSWAVCYTYATWFGVSGLIAAGQRYETSPAIRKACAFLLSKELPGGGWSESYLSCQVGMIVVPPFFCPRTLQGGGGWERELSLPPGELVSSFLSWGFQGEVKRELPFKQFPPLIDKRNKAACLAAHQRIGGSSSSYAGDIRS
jgi:hypothetical protein